MYKKFLTNFYILFASCALSLSLMYSPPNPLSTS